MLGNPGLEWPSVHCQPETVADGNRAVRDLRGQLAHDMCPGYAPGRV